jgi:hypothetical protein
MPQRVTGGGLGKTGPSHRIVERSLEHRFVKMVAVPPAGATIAVRAERRENPSPSPFTGSVRVLEGQGAGELDVDTCGDIPFVEVAHPLKVPKQGLHQAGGKDSDAVLLTLAVAHRQLAAIEIDVLHSQSRAFEQPKARSIHQGGHEPQTSREPRQDLADLVAAQDHGQALGSLGARHGLEARKGPLQNAAVQKQDRTEGLVLRRSADLAPGREIGEE